MPKSYKKGKKQDICCTIVQKKIHKGHFKEFYKGEQALKASFDELHLFLNHENEEWYETFLPPPPNAGQNIQHLLPPHFFFQNSLTQVVLAHCL